MRASHVVAAKDIVAATSVRRRAVRVIRPPFEISVHSRIFVESRVSEKEERGQRSLGSVAMQDECESTQPGLALSNPHFIRAFLIGCVIPILSFLPLLSLLSRSLFVIRPRGLLNYTSSQIPALKEEDGKATELENFTRLFMG